MPGDHLFFSFALFCHPERSEGSSTSCIRTLQAVMSLQDPSLRSIRLALNLFNTLLLINLAC